MKRKALCLVAEVAALCAATQPVFAAETASLEQPLNDLEEISEVLAGGKNWTLKNENDAIHPHISQRMGISELSITSRNIKSTAVPETGEAHVQFTLGVKALPNY